MTSLGSLLMFLCIGVPGAAAADPDQIRESRLIRAEPPSWRRALELPERGLDALVWPIKRSVIWAEDVNLPERVRDVLYFNEEKTAGWFPEIDLGGEIETAAGARIFHDDLFGAGEKVFASGLLAVDTFSGTPSLEEYQLRFGFRDPSIADSPVALRIQVFGGEDEDESLFVAERPDGSFVVSGKTRKSDARTYELDQARARVELAIAARYDLSFGLAFRPRFADVEEGEGREPPIPSTIDGFGGPAAILGGGPVIEWDARDQKHRPRSGWYLRGEGGYWEGVEGRTTTGREYRYARYTFDLQRHQPTFRPDRTILIRIALDRTEPLDGGAVPFWDLPVLDEDHSLRAFERNRFRDRGSLLANVEYRWPIWDTWDGFVFLDEGQVFHEYSNLEIGRFEWAAGIGARFYSASGLLFRAHFATGEEQREFRLGFAQEF